MDTIDKIDEAIRKCQNTEVENSTEPVTENTDTKIFDGNIDSNNDLEKTMEFSGVVEEKEEATVINKKSNDTLIIILYIISLVITVLLVSLFILFLY